MAVTRADKEAEFAQIEQALKGSDSAILVDYKGMNVPQVTELRRQLRSVKAQYKVVKNTIAKRALKGTAFEVLDKHFAGTTAVAYTNTDPVALAKALTKVAKDVPAFKFRAGLVEGRVISIAEIQQLANLPSKEELLSKIMFLLNAPAQRLAVTLNALPRNIAVVVSEAAKANKFGSGGGATAPAASTEAKPAEAAPAEATAEATPAPSPEAAQ